MPKEATRIRKITKTTFGLTNSKMAFGLTCLFFCMILISYSRSGLKLCYSILTFQGVSIGVHGSPYRPCIWRNVWTPKTRMVLKISFEQIVENQRIWSEMASENSIWGMETWIWLQISIQIHWWYSRTPTLFWPQNAENMPKPKIRKFWRSAAWAKPF